ncbi:hypothetical protein [Streptomyces sp. NPDC046862]|uniref:hypothetical protein n=1 Tax=Streptomyces sp. NPDC046862 TaxID=3154603 RepID=UPI003452A575
MEDKARPGEGREGVKDVKDVKGAESMKGAEGIKGVEGSHRRDPALTGHDVPAGLAEPEAPHATGRPASASASASAGSVRETPLLPHEETDKYSMRLQHAVGEFVDGPRGAVEEADHVLEEVASRLTDALTQRRRTLRMSWQSTGEGRAAEMDTEQLRLALRDYRELTERLLRT